MSEARIIQIPATLDAANRKADRSVSLRFTTMREVSTEDFITMDTYFQNAGHLLFRENAFKEEEVPDEDVEADIEKSQSVQVRDALWVLFRAKGNNSGDKEAWNKFYKQNLQAFKARILNEVHKLED